MSTEIVCDQCGRRAEPGVAAFEWWEVSNQAEGLELDFCSATCAAAFFTTRAPGPPTNGEPRAVHTLGDRDPR